MNDTGCKLSSTRCAELCCSPHRMWYAAHNVLWMYKRTFSSRIAEIISSTVYFAGVILGCGISMTRDCSVFMVGQYFKKRRELVELILATGTGTGISVMPIFIVECIRWIDNNEATTLLFNKGHHESEVDNALIRLWIKLFWQTFHSDEPS